MLKPVQILLAIIVLGGSLLVIHKPSHALEADREFAAMKVPGLPAVKISNPDAHIRAATAFVSTNFDWQDRSGKTIRGHHSFTEEQTCRVRFMSFWDVPSQEQVVTYRLMLNWWMQQLSFNKHVELPKEVPGTGGRLVWLDLKDYLWNSASWRAVAERELYILEPFIDHDHAEYLRRRLICPLSEKAKKGREVAIGQGRTERKMLLPAGSMVTAMQFIRDTLETDRTESYYDLLFSDYRFTNVKVTGGGYESSEKSRTRKTTIVESLVPEKPRLYVAGDGDNPIRLKAGTPYPPGREVYEWTGTRYVAWTVPPAREVVTEEETTTTSRSLPQGEITSTFVPFPRTQDDWNRAFGVDKIQAHMKERRIDLDFGAVVEGGQDNPKDGSIVALRNRLLSTLVGPYGAVMETFDVKQATGVKDFSESLIFAGGKFYPGEGAKAFRDAGELLAYLPNGGQAGMLIDGQGNRVETAGNDIAQDTGSTTKDVRVRNMGSCIVCHAPDGGYILPRDTISDGFSKGIKIRFKDRDQENRVRGFFKNQASRVKAFTEPYKELLAETTAIPAIKPGDKPTPGWTGVRLAKEVESFRKFYDGPLDLKAAAASVGVPEAELMKYLVKSPLNRLQQLSRGKPIPRRVWEVDGFANAGLIRQALVDEAYNKRK